MTQSTVDDTKTEVLCIPTTKTAWTSKTVQTGHTDAAHSRVL